MLYNETMRKKRGGIFETLYLSFLITLIKFEGNYETKLIRRTIFILLKKIIPLVFLVISTFLVNVPEKSSAAEIQAIVLSDSLNVYQDASLRTPVIGAVNKNDKVTILKEINGWSQIQSEKLNGWVYGKLLASHFTVTASSVNVYVDASLRVAVKGTLLKGTTGQISKEINGWYFVQTTAMEGWVYNTHLSEGSPAPATATENPAIVLSPTLNVYQQESMRSPVIGSIKKDTPVMIQKEINGWYKITSQSINGWVYGGLLPSTFTVSAPSLNIYQEPSLRTAVVSQMQKGNTGTITSEINGWYYIQAGTQKGWIYNTHITQGSPAPVVVAEIPAIVLSPSLDVYQQESMRSPIIGSIKKDTPVKIQKEINGWYKITSQNINGWVYRGLLNSLFTVSASSLNIYQEPSLRAGVTAQLQKGNSGTITSEINGWYSIVSQGKEGWIYYKHLTEGSPEPIVTILNEEAIVLPDQLAVYRDASTRTPVIGYFDKNQPVTIKQSINGWYQVASPEMTGWVYGNLLKSNVIVKPSRVDVYLNATTRTTIVTTLAAQTAIKIVKENNGWYQIETADLTGWVYKTHLENGSPEYKKLEAVVLADTNLYYEPYDTSRIIGLLSVNQETFVTREVNGWYETINDQGVRGWAPVSSVMLKQQAPQLPLTGKMIVLDAGHGGYDGGASGPLYATGVKTLEKDLTLQTVKQLSVKLTSLGATVVLTRSTDVYIALADRVKVSIANNADAFVSVHYNSSTSSSVSGIETLYYYSNRDLPLASAIHSSLLRYINLPDRKVKYQDLHVLRENTRPSTLVELGFISNPLELALVKTSSYQDRATTAIAEGLLKYFGK